LHQEKLSPVDYVPPLPSSIAQTIRRPNFGFASTYAPLGLVFRIHGRAYMANADESPDNEKFDLELANW